MAGQLWLLRHGDAEPHGARPDAERALTERGRRQALAAGRTMALLRVAFDAVYASPRTRALDTALIAADELGCSPRVHQPLGGGFTAAAAQTLLAGCREGARILLVGHEPDFSQVVYDFTGARIELRKGGVAVVRVEHAELLRLLRPREMELLAGLG